MSVVVLTSGWIFLYIYDLVENFNETFAQRRLHFVLCFLHFYMCLFCNCCIYFVMKKKPLFLSYAGAVWQGGATCSRHMPFGLWWCFSTCTQFTRQ